MVTITRTANAGCLLQMDGVDILLDGVCGEVSPFLPTPPSVLAELKRKWPDVVAVTHTHPDHYDASFCESYCTKTGREVLLPGSQGCKVGAVTVTPVPSRHLGRNDHTHTSYILEGSHCIWFLGDASPLQWKDRCDLPKPDVVIAPYACAATESAWCATKALGADKVILLHLPAKEYDPHGLWPMVQQTLAESRGTLLYIPEIMEIISIS